MEWMGVGAIGTVATVTAARLVHRYDFYTDFTESDPLAFWRRLEMGDLAIEPFDGKMSAVPTGPSLLVPSGKNANGMASIHFNLPVRPA
jgi:hypothetical protein